MSEEQLDLVPTAPSAAPALVENAPPSLTSFIATAVRDPSIDVTKLRALLDMQRELLADQARGAFNRALVKLQSEITQISRDGTVELGTGKGSYKFARWEDMDRVLRPLLAENGFALSFDSSAREGGGATVAGKLLHAEGHAETASISLPLDTGPGRNNLQALGSTISYAKRYLAEMLLNIVRKGADDDGVSGQTKLVTQEQAEEIERLIRETKSDRSRFMEHFGIASMLNMREDEYAPAVNMLNAKLARKKQAAPRDAEAPQ